MGVPLLGRGKQEKDRAGGGVVRHRGKMLREEKGRMVTLQRGREGGEVEGRRARGAARGEWWTGTRAKEGMVSGPLFVKPTACVGHHQC